MDRKPIFIILALLISTMGTFVVLNMLSNFTGFVEYIGFGAEGNGTLLSWILALVVVAVYSFSASTISDIRFYMFKMDLLKGMAVLAAVCAGIVEEIVFRKWIMDYLASSDYSIAIQVIASGLAFGVVHLIWGMRNWKAGVNAGLSTFMLGIALAVVYVVGERSLAPCIVAHFLVSALIEPGLLISVQKNRLGYWSEVQDKL